MAKPVNLSVEELRQLFSYDPGTGKFVWRVGVRRGKEAFGCLDSYGYFIGRVAGKNLKAHRVAWAIHHGEWPDKQIDHINGVRSDNRISNLRNVGASANHRNMKRARNNKTGITGVSRVARDGTFMVSVGCAGEGLYLGCYRTMPEARAARKAAEVILQYSKRHGTPP